MTRGVAMLRTGLMLGATFSTYRMPWLSLARSTKRIDVWRLPLPPVGWLGTTAANWMFAVGRLAKNLDKAAQEAEARRPR